MHIDLFVSRMLEKKNQSDSLESNEFERDDCGEEQSQSDCSLVCEYCSVTSLASRLVYDYKLSLLFIFPSIRVSYHKVMQSGYEVMSYVYVRYDYLLLNWLEKERLQSTQFPVIIWAFFIGINGYWGK